MMLYTFAASSPPSFTLFLLPFRGHFSMQLGFLAPSAEAKSGNALPNR
jgi:hypothetical protein